MHFDSDEAVDGRRLSAIFYLNPGWQPGDGGALRLFPFAASPVDIAPMHDRLVLFASTRMLHRCERTHSRAAIAPRSRKGCASPPPTVRVAMHLRMVWACAGLTHLTHPQRCASWLAA